MVNIKDVKEFEKEGKLENKNFLKQIFDKQKELLEKYRDIENMPVKVDINNAQHQKLLKEFTFRGIEELAEAYEAFLDKNNEHFIEELSDAIHFFTEVLLMVEINSEEIKSIDKFKSKIINYSDILIYYLWSSTYDFSIACNRLKCKPWKQTQILTDIDNYKGLLIHAYNNFMQTLNDLGFSGKEILDIYMQKHLVNKFRIRSKY